MSAFHDNALMGASGSQGYQISRSVRLRSSASAYFNRTPAGAGTSNKTFTYSAWVKRGSLGSIQNLISSPNTGNSDSLRFSAADALEYNWQDTVVGQVTTTQVFRDPSAWYHIMFAMDTTQATASNRFKLYVNGVQVTAFSTANYPAQNTVVNNTAAVATKLGQYANSSTQNFDGYLTEVNFIDGQALTPSSFGENDTVTGVWKPKKYAGTYGTNGFYLNFSDNSNNTATTIGKDYSGNGNNWTPNNISVTSGVTYDSMLDVPTLTSATAANYCVLNPLNKAPSDVVLSNGNLEASSSFTTDHRCFASTFQVTTGKWYWEVQYATGTISAGSNIVGIFNLPTPDTANNRRPADSVNNGIGIRQDGQYESDNTSAAYFGSSISVGDVIGVALDADAGTVKFNVNGGSFGSTLTFVSAGGVYTAGGDIRASSGTPKTIHNFGQRPFAYTPPSGFKALNTQNLPAPTISNGALYMAATTYTGNGVNNRAITGVGFQPDLVWTKARSAAYDALITDAVRGSGKSLTPSSTGAEVTNNGNGYVSAFNADGFTLTQGVSSIISVNESGQTYVAWQWKAGGAGSSNTSGSITSTVSVNATAGFSVVTFTATGSNATVGHGLGVAPAMVIVKDRASSGNWAVYHQSLPSAAYYLYMNTTAAQGNVAAIWNNTAPTSTVFSIGTWHTADAQVAYCFAEVAGYSAAFSFNGNGSADGVFVYLGFRPRMILLKRTDTTGNWYIWDTSRNTYNVLGEELYPNLSNAGATATDLDFLSNGFKMRNSTAGFNASGGTYIGFAWAENPFKYSLGM